MGMSTDAQPNLRECVETVVERYLADLEGDAPSGLHEMIIEEVERTLIATVMRHCGGQRITAAAWLGINRNTLRKKLLAYGLDD